MYTLGFSDLDTSSSPFVWVCVFDEDTKIGTAYPIHTGYRDATPVDDLCDHLLHGIERLERSIGRIRRVIMEWPSKSVGIALAFTIRTFFRRIPVVFVTWAEKFVCMQRLQPSLTHLPRTSRDRKRLFLQVSRGSIVSNAEDALYVADAFFQCLTLMSTTSLDGHRVQAWSTLPDTL